MAAFILTPTPPSLAHLKSSVPARTFSTSAANPRGQARKVFPRPKRCAGSSRCSKNFADVSGFPSPWTRANRKSPKPPRIRARNILNDVTALRADPRLADIARRRKLPLILMHMRGDPQTMQKKPFARNVLRNVSAGLRHTVAIARRAGIAKSQIVLDPGIGFGKSAAQNFVLLQKLPELARLGFPLLVGVSRKGFIGRALGGVPKGERAWAPQPRWPQAFSVAHTSFAFTTSPKWCKSRASPMPCYIPPRSPCGPERNERRRARDVPRRACQLAQCPDRRLPRLDARRLRFLHPHLCPHAGGGGVPQIRR